MSTNAQLIDQIASAVKDPTKSKRSAAKYAEILTDAQDDLNEEFQILRKIDSSSLTLIADTELVGNLPSDFFSFVEEDNDDRAGQVAVGTNREFVLSPTSIPLLDVEHLGWKETSAGTPEKFYLIYGASIQLSIWPKASSTIITANGSAVNLHYVFQPSAVSYNSDLPFNNSQRLRGLGPILKLKAIRQIFLEDAEIEKAVSFDTILQREQDKKMGILRSILRIPGGAGFDRRTYNAY